MSYWHNEFKKIAQVYTLKLYPRKSLARAHIISRVITESVVPFSISFDGPARVWYSDKICKLKLRKLGLYLGSPPVVVCKLLGTIFL